MASTFLKIICFLGSLVFLIKAILFIYIGIMLYKDNYSQYKTKDDCNKSSPDILKVICPFWSGNNSKCINGMYNDENNCTPRNSIYSFGGFIVMGLLFGLMSIYIASFVFTSKGNNYPSGYNSIYPGIYPIGYTGSYPGKDGTYI